MGRFSATRSSMVITVDFTNYRIVWQSWENFATLNSFHKSKMIGETNTVTVQTVFQLLFFYTFVRRLYLTQYDTRLNFYSNHSMYANKMTEKRFLGLGFPLRSIRFTTRIQRQLWRLKGRMTTTVYGYWWQNPYVGYFLGCWSTISKICHRHFFLIMTSLSYDS